VAGCDHMCSTCVGGEEPGFVGAGAAKRGGGHSLTLWCNRESCEFEKVGVSSRLQQEGECTDQ
jgi:hypothetical protein